MGNLPWLPLNTKDFYTDEAVRLMTWEQRGIYGFLIACQWEEGSIPADLGDIAKLCQVQPKHMKSIWFRISRCFQPHPDDPNRLINARCFLERAKTDRYRASRSENGKMGGRPRKYVEEQGGFEPDGAEDGAVDEKPYANHMESIWESTAKAKKSYSQSQSEGIPPTEGIPIPPKCPPSKSSRRRAGSKAFEQIDDVLSKHTIPATTDVEEITSTWGEILEAFPKREGNTGDYGAAMRVYVEAVCEHAVAPETVLRKVVEYSDAVNGSDKKFVQMISTWFNQAGWTKSYRSKESFGQELAVRVCRNLGLTG